MDRRATRFFPPTVLLTMLVFATVSAVVKSWDPHPGAAGLEVNGD